MPKKDSSYRPVINLRPLNHFIEKSHLKIEGLPAVKELLQKDNWLCMMDLKDAYLTVAVVQEHRKYLRFVWEAKTLLSSFRFFQYSKGIHKAPSASDGTIASSKPPISDLTG